VLSHPVILVLLVAFAVLLAVCFWSAWRGRRVDFIHQLALGTQTEEVAAHVFDQLIPVLVQDGYAMVAQGGHTTVFEHRFLPGWTVLVAIFLFPFGLVALLARGRETVVIVSGDRVLELHGYCSKATADFIVAVADDVAAQLASAR
jgi:hypothetical protein